MTLKADICVLGAGSGGLSVAVGAAHMGASVILIEKGKMGGNCLNYGCVPSKALLSVAKAADTFNVSGVKGLTCKSFHIDHQKVYSYVQGAIGAIAPHDSVERMESMGIRVLKGEGRFISPRIVQVGNQQIKALRYVIATGARPTIPRIQGIDEIHYYTNETIFNAKGFLPHLVIIGGGPVGVEMAQAHRRLGSEVTLIQKHHILPKDDVEAVAVVRDFLMREGINILENSTVISTRKEAGEIVVNLKSKGKIQEVRGTHVLLAAGRYPSVDPLDLEAADIDYTSKGIVVDSSLRTTNSRVYAIGDVKGGPHFTHMTNYEAEVALRNILFRWPIKAQAKPVPWVTYTDPEIAHVGLNEAECEEQDLEYRVLRFPFVENDRAQVEMRSEGLIKVLATPKGYVLGVTIVGVGAGDLILPWILMIDEKLKLKSMASTIVPYPLRSEVSKHVAGLFSRPFLFGKIMGKITRFLGRFW